MRNTAVLENRAHAAVLTANNSVLRAIRQEAQENSFLILKNGLNLSKARRANHELIDQPI